MITTNPFAILSASVSPLALKIFVIVMVAFVVIGTLLDIIHKKMFKIFLIMQRKQKRMLLKN